ncbi:hypothetical protein OH799_31565 [Nocardia sp. NBC_00881]|uniref:hypothetical protein n=1 Tax=Nocardia sp. NBC_00881 TaxID=2975995 RepID=UPI00386F4097|nr:hypothetical protein OH799_31565 [Nocardia sp. NBC_00881]
MTTNTAARRLLTCAAIIGAITAGGAGLAAAESHSGPSDPRNGSGNTTGWHHIDPMGYHHQERNPLRRQQQRDAIRDYHQRQNQPAPSDTTGDNGSSSWSQVQRPDGSGYTVCRPQASWCQ